MLEDTFELNIVLGELEFEVTGTYSIELDEYDVIFNSTFVTIYVDNQELTINAEPILNSLDSWGKLEETIIAKFSIN